MKTEKSNKQPVVLITGCSSGIGRDLAAEFFRRECRVIATARSEISVHELKKYGFDAYQLDVTRTDDIEWMAATTQKKYGRLDILVNNAGYGLIAPLMDVSAKALEDQFRTNVFAPMQLIRQFAPLMRASGNAVIANIGSISGLAPTPFAGPYCASKAAMNSLSDVLRMELKPFGIHVVSVQPGAIRSEFGSNTSRGAASMDINSWYKSLAGAIELRAISSQQNSMPSKEFSKKLVSSLMLKNPPPVVRIGPLSTTLPALKKYLPERILDSLLMRRFGLDNLSNDVRR